METPKAWRYLVSKTTADSVRHSGYVLQSCEDEFLIPEPGRGAKLLLRVLQDIDDV
jgi:hypothetical protein